MTEKQPLSYGKLIAGIALATAGIGAIISVAVYLLMDRDPLFRTLGGFMLGATLLPLLIIPITMLRKRAKK